MATYITPPNFLWSDVLGTDTSKQSLVAKLNILSQDIVAINVGTDLVTTPYNPHELLIGPTTGGAASPSPRLLVTGDLPVVDLTHGGTGATDAAAARVNFGLGSMATQDAGAVAITGGTWNGGTIGQTTPVTSIKTDGGTQGDFSPAPLDVRGTASGATSAVTKILNLSFHDARTTQNQANQVLRFTYTRDAGASAGPVDRDSAIVVTPNFNENLTTQFDSIKLEGPTIASGKTVAATRGLSIHNGGGSGTLTTMYGLYVESLTKGSTNYAIYTNSGGIVRLGGTLQHDGAAVGFFGATAAARPAVYTQTYGSTSRTHNSLTSSTLTNSNGTGSTTIASVGTSFNQTTLNNINRSLSDQINALRADLVNVKDVLNQALDDLQTLGLLQ